MEKTDIKSLDYDELKDFFVSIGEKPFRAKQVYQWMHEKQADGFEEMTNLSKSLREKLAETCEYTLSLIHILVCLFGCCGNRARSRRFEMGEVSGRLADLTIITSDNPRFEKPLDIIADIRTGIEKTDGKYIEIPDRKEAIAWAIHHGQKGDVIVLAGKGHEDYQEIEGKKYPMDERVLIREILAEDAAKGK